MILPPPPAEIREWDSSLESYASSRPLNPSKVKVSADPSKLFNFPNEFVHRRRLIALDGKTLLRLRNDIVVRVDPVTVDCTVVGWDLVLRPHQIDNLHDHIARRFLTLFSKAENQSLAPVEAKVWLAILDNVDYAAFCAERAAPEYVEGVLLEKEPVCRVEWHDGERQVIPVAAAAALRILQIGDRFGAFVKWERSGEPKEVERLSVLPD